MLAGAAQDLATHRAVGLPRGWRWAAELGAGAGARVCGVAAANIVPGSVTAGRTPGVTDQDLRRSEAWLIKCRRLAGVIRAVVAGLLLQAHCCGHGRGEHLARPRRGAGGRVVGWMMGHE